MGGVNCWLPNLGRLILFTSVIYSVNYVYPTEIKGHLMVSLIIPPVYHFNHHLAFEWLIEVFILLPFHNSNKRLQIANARNNGKDIHVACSSCYFHERRR